MAKFRNRWLVLLFCFLLLLPLFPHSAAAAEEKLLIPGGELFGVRMSAGGLVISSVGEVKTSEGVRSPGRAAGLAPGDILKSAGGVPLTTAADLSRLVSRGKPLEITGERAGKPFRATLVPAREEKGAYLAGLWVRQGASGIGTITFFDPETGSFYGLGHGICDGESGLLFPLASGTVHGAQVQDLIKGIPGVPGEIRGTLKPDVTGQVLYNRRTGVSGRYEGKIEGQAIPLAKKDQVRPGKATLLCTLDGKKEEYEVEIETVCDRFGETKNMIIHVTDPRLLEKTGGIIQGMSGSPLLQNGRLVGAVTHVLVHDPTRGYGIFLENMLNR